MSVLAASSVYALSSFFFLKDACGHEQKPDVALVLLNKCSALDMSGVYRPHFPLHRPSEIVSGIMTPSFRLLELLFSLYKTVSLPFYFVFIADGCFFYFYGVKLI